MVLLILLILLLVLFGGLGIAWHLLWIVAVVCLVVIVFRLATGNRV